MLQFNAAWLECDGWSWNSSTICLGPTVEIISMFVHCKGYVAEKHVNVKESEIKRRLDNTAGR
jgi:hypothetical protein